MLVTGGWATIRNENIGGYVLGNAYGIYPYQATFDVTNTASSPWYYGYAYGDYNDCGWIISSNLTNDHTTGNSYCGSAGTNFPTSEFTNGQISPCCSGTSVAITEGCGEYANDLPRTGTDYPEDLLRVPYPPYNVYWRYVTKAGLMVLVNDQHVADGHGSWVFMYRACFPATLP